MQLTINWVGTTIPSRRIHPNIILHQLVTVCCVICRLFHEVPAFSCHHPLIHVYNISTAFHCSTASPPLHSIPKIPNDILCIWGTPEPQLMVYSQYLLSYSYSAKTRCHDSRYLAPEPPPNESADEVDCIAAWRRLWMAAIHRWMRPEDRSTMVALSPLLYWSKLFIQKRGRSALLPIIIRLW